MCSPPSLSMNCNNKKPNNPGFAGWMLSRNSAWQEQVSGALLLYRNMKNIAFRGNFLWYKEDPKGKINLMFLLHCFQLSGITFMLSAPKRIKLTFFQELKRLVACSYWAFKVAPLFFYFFPTFRDENGGEWEWIANNCSLNPCFLWR